MVVTVVRVGVFFTRVFFCVGTTSVVVRLSCVRSVVLE